MALLAVLAEGGAAACPTRVALLPVLAEGGAAACPTRGALLPVLAESGAAAWPTLAKNPPVRAVLVNATFDWMWRGRRGHLGQTCAIHASSITLARVAEVKHKDCAL